MPHQYGLPGYTHSPPSSPSQHIGTLLPRISGSSSVVISGSTGSTSGSMIAAVSVFRQQTEDKRLTREAMEKYLRDRSDMVIVILHAKVKKHNFRRNYRTIGQFD